MLRSPRKVPGCRPDPQIYCSRDFSGAEIMSSEFRSGNVHFCKLQICCLFGLRFLFHIVTTLWLSLGTKIHLVRVRKR